MSGAAREFSIFTSDPLLFTVVEGPLAEGSVVVIEMEDVRIRRLPIHPDETPGGWREVPMLREERAAYKVKRLRKRKKGG